MDPQIGQSLDEFSFSLCSTLCHSISFGKYWSEYLDQFWVKNFEMIGWLHPPIRDLPNLWIWSLPVLPHLCWVFQPISFFFVCVLEVSCFPGIWDLPVATSSSPFPIPHYYTPVFWFLTHCISFQSSPISDPVPLSPPNHVFIPSPSILYLKWAFCSTF